MIFKKSVDLYRFLFLYYRVMKIGKIMKNVILVLISLFMCSGCLETGVFVAALNSEQEMTCCDPAAANCGVEVDCGYCEWTIAEWDSLISTQSNTLWVENRIEGCIY